MTITCRDTSQAVKSCTGVDLHDSFSFGPSGIQVLCTYSHVVLPVHPPEVDDGVGQRALRCNVGLWAVHTLSREPKTGQGGCCGKSSLASCVTWRHGAIKKQLDLCFYLDEVSVDIICVLIGGF